jgi:hypothetical protein
MTEEELRQKATRRLARAVIFWTAVGSTIAIAFVAAIMWTDERISVKRAACKEQNGIYVYMVPGHICLNKDVVIQ